MRKEQQITLQRNLSLRGDDQQHVKGEEGNNPIEGPLFSPAELNGRLSTEVIEVDDALAISEQMEL